MVDHISVSHGDIEAQAKNLGTIKNQIEETLHSAKQQIDSLRESGGFDSSAGSGFNETYHTWNTSAMTTVSALGDMEQYLTKASNAFREVDQAFTPKG